MIFPYHSIVFVVVVVVCCLSKKDVRYHGSTTGMEAASIKRARGSNFNQCKEMQSATTTKDRSLFETHFGPADLRILLLLICGNSR